MLQQAWKAYHPEESGFKCSPPLQQPNVIAIFSAWFSIHYDIASTSTRPENARNFLLICIFWEKARRNIGESNSPKRRQKLFSR